MGVPLNIGDTVKLDFPGHERHGKTARVVMIEPELDLAPPDGPHTPMFTVFVTWPGLPQPVGIGPQHIGGTVENQRLRAESKGDAGEQGELLL